MGGLWPNNAEAPDCFYIEGAQRLGVDVEARAVAGGWLGRAAAVWDWVGHPRMALR